MQERVQRAPGRLAEAVEARDAVRPAYSPSIVADLTGTDWIASVICGTR